MKRSISLLLALFLLLSPSAGMCSERTETVPRELLTKVLNEWEQSNNELQSLLEEQKADLNEASTELENLKSTLEKQRETLAALRKELTECRSELTMAQNSLNAANAELNTIVAGVKDIESKKRLAERQRNFWQVIAAALGIFAAVK
ncbi:hypothetical protein [Schwartzia succinivorans]|jgi:septal ring factor EnvC (AmiA/AmiB activator)|uniref:hypothetical protein n=1 Tax=Schwartzia succinivorans TaxID=55507 RepID=UPI000932B0FC|nr:hypothetical protein [Schwartzia succinivorans]